jgi:hypothetical protein
MRKIIVCLIVLLASLFVLTGCVQGCYSDNQCSEGYTCERGICLEVEKLHEIGEIPPLEEEELIDESCDKDENQNDIADCEEFEEDPDAPTPVTDIEAELVIDPCDPDQSDLSDCEEEEVSEDEADDIDLSSRILAGNIEDPRDKVLT